MSNEAPFHKLTPLDEAGGGILGQLGTAGGDPFLLNFADDEMVMDWHRQNIVPLAMRCRTESVELHEEWHTIRNMLTMNHDEGRKYIGRSDAYLPIFARALGVRVSHVAQALFPTDDYVDVDPAPDFVEQAQPVKAWMKHQFEKQMKLRSTIKPFLRNLAAYGFAVGKVWWHKDDQNYISKARNPISSLMLPTLRPRVMREGARFRAVNVFSWFAWPLSVDSIERASLVMEDMQINQRDFKLMGERNGWKNLDQVAISMIPDNVDYDLTMEMYATARQYTTAVNPRFGGELATWMYLTEAYCSMPLPKKAYLPGEKPGDPVPVQMLFSGGWPVLVRRNPFWFQAPPYVIRRLNEVPDVLMGTGLGRLGRSLQMLANDFMNQANDNGSYAMNPFIVVNPDMVDGELEPLEPGRVWKSRDVNAGIKIDRPPSDQSQVGMQVVQLVAGYMNDLLGTPPILQGSGTKGAARTATGAQILQNNTKTDLADEVEDVELEVLIPLMEMVHSLGQQYQQQAITAAVAGGPITIPPEALVGDFGFRWLASSQAMNKQMRAQQTMQFLQAIQPLIPLMMQQGYVFDPVPLLEQLYKDGLGFKNFNNVVKQVGPNQMETMVAMGMGSAAQAGGPGAPPAPEMGGGAAPPAEPPGAESAMTSMAERSNGPTGEMSVGEAEAGGQTEMLAQALAAEMGALGGR